MRRLLGFEAKAVTRVGVVAGGFLAALSRLSPLSLTVIGVAALCGLGILLYGRWKLEGQEQRHQEVMEQMRQQHERAMVQLKKRTT